MCAYIYVKHLNTANADFRKEKGKYTQTLRPNGT